MQRSPMKATKDNSEYYQWGENCDGWHLVKTDSLSVIEELMPPNTQETLHYHKKAQQFFRILKGIASFEIDGKVIELKSGEGINILPNTNHLIRNNQSENLEFLVISQPSTRGDRYEVKAK